MRGLPRKGLVAALFMAALFAQMLPAAAAPPQGDPVARVIKISENGRLDFSRDDGKWYQAFVEMKDYKNDKLRTSADTHGSIEFYTGGQIGLNKGTTIEITSNDTANVINMKQGGLWGKLGTQKEKPVQIQTSSGVMGIRGTEFVITDTGDSTEVAVLEGEVSVTPTGSETPIMLGAGEKLRLDKLKDVETVTAGEVQKSDPEELRSEILDSQEWEDFNEALGWASYISGYVPGSGFSNGLYWANRGVNVVNNPKQAAASFVGGQVGGRIGSGISRLGSSGGKKTPDFPSELQPDGDDGAGAVEANNLEFKWDKTKKTDHYFVMVARDAEMGDIVWTHETGKDETKVKYPADAQPLAPGRYYWRVIPLDEEGEPAKDRKAAQTWLTIE